MVHHVLGGHREAFARAEAPRNRALGVSMQAFGELGVSVVYSAIGCTTSGIVNMQQDLHAMRTLADLYYSCLRVRDREL